MVTNAYAALSQPSTMQQPSTNYSLRPSSPSSSLMNSVVTTTAPVQRRQSGNDFTINTGVANSVAPKDTGVANNAATNKIKAREKIANSVAVRLMKSNGIKNANIENLVALGILSILNRGVNMNSSMQKNVPLMVTDDQYRMSDEPSYEPSMTSRTNTVVANDESLLYGSVPRVAKLSEVCNTSSKVPKRGLWKQMSDISLMSNKRWRQ